MSWILDTLPFPKVRPCKGPLVRFDVPSHCPVHGEHEAGAALLECSQCSAIFMSGNYLDPAHANTPTLRSPH